MFHRLLFLARARDEDKKLPHEDIRSVIEVSHGTYAIIMPKSWIRYNKLKAKDKLRVISNGKVTIYPEKIQKMKV